MISKLGNLLNAVVVAASSHDYERLPVTLNAVYDYDEELRECLKLAAEAMDRACQYSSDPDAGDSFRFSEARRRIEKAIKL